MAARSATTKRAPSESAQAARWGSSPAKPLLPSSAAPGPDGSEPVDGTPADDSRAALDGRIADLLAVLDVSRRLAGMPRRRSASASVSHVRTANLPPRSNIDVLPKAGGIGNGVAALRQNVIEAYVNDGWFTRGMSLSV